MDWLLLLEFVIAFIVGVVLGIVIGVLINKPKTKLGAKAPNLESTLHK